MIIAQQKPLEEIRNLIAPYKKVLVLGCGTCVTVCFAGGEKEVGILASTLRLAQQVNGGDKELSEATVKRQCEWEYLDEVADQIKEADAVLSLACGIGVQAVAERFPKAIALPGVNTAFMGLPQEQGVWSERCAACGNCILGEMGGVCPIARCSKSLLNGPCGGSQNGKCEVSPDIPCGWQLIYDRLSAMGQLSRLEAIVPPKNWRTSFAGGPRRIVREDLKIGGARQ
ncbi:MAG: methylenetetrahydrofolate reductase C-terminal domain-containing protein [Chloroflexota bacterium]|nr:methylenetetrahydrofolate reductase C-terminal domain-containing protein [Chloroflexota bacterium]